jgi:hypothetical protein
MKKTGKNKIPTPKTKYNTPSKKKRKNKFSTTQPPLKEPPDKK